MASDDLLDPSEIEALLGAAGGNEPKAPAESPSTPPVAESPSTASSTQSATTGGNPEQLLNQAEADLAAAIATDLGSAGAQPGLDGTEPFSFRNLGNLSIDPKRKVELDALQDVELDLRIELGRTELLIEDVLSLKAGSVVPLDKLAGDPVDIVVNGWRVARGEVLVLNDNFCIRVAEILSPDF